MNKQLRNRLVVYIIIMLIIFVFNIVDVSPQYQELLMKENERDELQLFNLQLIEDEKYLAEELVKFDDPEYVINYAKKNHLFTEKGTIKFRIPNKNSE